MERNFEFSSGDIEIVVEGRRFDLHNDFGLESYAFEASPRRLTLKWTSRHSRERLKLVFEGVSYLWVSPRDPAVPPTDDDCLQFIGFQRLAGETATSFLDDVSVRPDDLMILSFQSDWEMKVQAEQAMASI